MSRLRVAVIGVGHLGKEHARILVGLPDVELVGVADTNLDQAQAVAKRIGVKAFADYWPLLNLVDAATVVVPSSLHEDVAAEFLRRGLPVMVEKPLALTAAAASKLADLADSNGTILQVGHIERFNPAFEELQRRRIHPKYIRAERLGPFSGRAYDIGVVLDLMIHDIDLLLAMFAAPIESVEAFGVCIFGPHEDVANARLRFANGCIADLTASRAHPTPYRQMHLWGAEGYAGIDFAQQRLKLVQPSESVRAHGLDPSKLDPASRALIKDELFGRHLETCTVTGRGCDQLTCELQEFVKCVQSGAQPRVSGRAGQAAIAVAEQIIGSMKQHAWTESAAGPCGPAHAPSPVGLLFPPRVSQEVA